MEQEEYHRPRRHQREGKALHRGNKLCPVFLKFYKPLKKHPVIQAQPDKDRNNGLPRVEDAVLTVFRLRQQARENGSCDKGDSPLQERAQEKPYGSAHLYGQSLIFSP